MFCSSVSYPLGLRFVLEVLWSRSKVDWISRSTGLIVCAALAQSAERFTRNEKVASSILASGSNLKQPVTCGHAVAGCFVFGGVDNKWG